MSIFIKTFTYHSYGNKLHFWTCVVSWAVPQTPVSWCEGHFSKCTMNSAESLTYAMLNCSWSTAPTWVGIFSIRQDQASSCQQKASFPFMVHEKGILLTLQKSFLAHIHAAGTTCPCESLLYTKCSSLWTWWTYRLTSTHLLCDQSFLLAHFISLACRKSWTGWKGIMKNLWLWVR